MEKSFYSILAFCVCLGCFLLGYAIFGVTVNNKTEENNKLQTQNELIVEQLNTLTESNNALTSQVGFLNAKVTMLTSSGDQLVFQLRQKEQLISDLRLSGEQKDARISELETDKQELQNEVARLTQSEEENTAEIARLNARIVELERTISDLQASGEQKDEEIQNLQSEKQTLQNEVARLNQSVEDKTTEIANLNTQISQLQETINALNLSDEQKTQEIARLNNEISTLRATIQENEQTLAETNTQLTSLQSSLDSANEKVDELVLIVNADNELFKQLRSGAISEVTAEDLGSMTEIRPYYFYGCTNLTKIELPSTVKSIGSNAFYGCTGLKEITLNSDTVVSLDKVATVPFSETLHGTVNVPGDLIESYKTSSNWETLYNNSYITFDTITVEVATTSAQYFTFNGNAVTGYTGTDTQIVIPRSYSKVLTETSQSFIRFFDALDYVRTHDVVFPFTITANGQEYSYSSVDDFDNDYSNLSTARNLMFNGTVATFIDGTDYKITSIDVQAFRDKTSLTNVVLLNNITVIEESAFNGCTNLSSITIPNSVEKIGTYAFSRTSITSITIPKSLTTMGNTPVSSCTKLESIIVEKGNSKYHSEGNCLIETATNKLISGCKNSVIPDYVTSMGSYAFNGIIGLNSITIPNSVTDIGFGTFDGCTGLTSITIPESVTNIQGWAFIRCSNLKEITVLATMPPTLSSNSAIPDTTTTIYVLNDSVSAYQSATNWSTYASKIQELPAEEVA